MRLSLRTKILLLIAGTVMGLAVVVLVALGALAGREIERAVRSDVRATGGVLARIVRERSAALRDQCLLFVRQPVLKALLGLHDPAIMTPTGGGDAATVADSLREFLKEIRADAALVTDQDGYAFGETDAPFQESSDYRREAGIAAALRGETWSGVVARRGHLMLAVSVPIFEPVSKYVRGTFTAYSVIDSNVARELKHALGSEVVFVHGGQVVGTSLPFVERMLTPQDAPVSVTLGGERYFALYAPLPDTDPRAGMGFVTLRPYDRAMALYRRLGSAFLIVSVLALLLALGAGATVARSLTRPLEGVVNAALVLREGGWPERFEVKRADEIGLLQSVFNEMIASLRAGQERLLALLDTDPLTELDNHRRFQERLAQEVRRCAASGEALSLLLLDIDHFHSFNLRHGHAAGDRALQRVAQVLRDGLPEVAIPARYGGEEFAVLLPQHDLAQAERIAERMRLAALEVWRHEEGSTPLSLSVGCAEFGTHTTRAEGLTLAAELAVSQAKLLGRNRVCRFDSVPGADENADPYQLYRFLKDGSLATIQALAAAVDAKDSYTQGHSQRVAQYAAELAGYVGLSREDQDLVYTTGTLHDVGKIGVPDSILKKPARLEEDERAVIETHPVLGEVIIRKAPQLASTLPGVRHHHERWDGKGYPDRLAGESIPLVARILAVADTFDAMTSDRPYRKGMSFDVALNAIAEGAGTQFDPELASAFVAMMRARHILARAA